MGVSKNRGKAPQIINHPFWGAPETPLLDSRPVPWMKRT